MTELVIPRRLAIALMAEAQKAAGPVAGFIGEDAGAPGAVSRAAQGAVWARFHSGESPDADPGRQLLVTLDTKGVLQLRCFEDGVERALKIA